MRNLKEKIKNFSIPKENKGPFCGQCSRFALIPSEIPITATDQEEILSQIAFNGLPGKGKRFCSAKGLATAGGSCERLPEFSPRICGACKLFHPEVTPEGLEASMTGTIIARESPKNKIQYGKLGCINDAYGGLSVAPCSEPDKFQPKK